MITGDRVKLNVIARDANGRQVAPAGAFSFVSREPATVSVDATGTVSSLAAGFTYVVVTLPVNAQTLEDSIPVAVGELVGADRTP